MSMSHPAVVRIADEHAAPCLAKVAAGAGSAEELDRLALSCAAVAEVTTGSVAQQWLQLSERLRGDAMMARAALAGSEGSTKQSRAA